MNEALLCFVAIPCTPHVQDILNILSITNVRYPADTAFTKEYGLFIYNSILELETVNYAREWILENKDAIQVLAYYSNKDFNGLCTYLNTLPERPFNVYINSSYFT